MANPDILFRGIPRGPTRGYTARALAAFRPERLVIPCAGSFSLAVVARQAGVPAEAIVCGDISLYSTALGRALMGRDWRLEAREGLGVLVRPYLTDPVSKAAAVLFAVRALQYETKQDKVHLRDRYRELVVNVDAYVGQLKAQIEEMCELLHGLFYEARDMWETLEDHRADPRAALLVNPPRYTGGYKRMFAGVEGVFDWDAPRVPQFTEKDYARLMDTLGQSEALTLMYYATPQEDPSSLWGAPWRAVFADRPGHRRGLAVNWIIANRSPAEPAITRTKLVPNKGRYPLFSGEIVEGMTLWAEKVPKQVGDYYRDLFIHKLPGSYAELYAVLLLDGYLVAVAGVHWADFRRGHRGRTWSEDWPVSFTFAFTVPHARYKRLHKLTLMSLASRWFWEAVIGDAQHIDLIGLPRQVGTTMLTPYPENKTARGVLKLEKRERQPDGSYKLTYRARIQARNAQETLDEWQKKYANVTR